MDGLTFLKTYVPLFDGVAGESLERMLDHAGTRCLSLPRGEYLLRAGDSASDLIIIQSGRLSVYRDRLLMRHLEAGDVAGVATLYGDSDISETDLKASRAARALLIPREAVIRAIRQDSVLAENYIRFLSSRVRYLNQVVRRLSGPDTTARLARFLLERAYTQGNPFPLNAEGAARALAMGRASLYRALDTLQHLGCVEKNKRIIRIINMDQLRDLAN